MTVAWLPVDALSALSRVAEGADLKAARLSLLALAEIAAERGDAEHQGFAATGQEVAARAELRPETLTRAITVLERADVLRTREAGGRTRWRILATAPRQETLLPVAAQQAEVVYDHVSLSRADVARGARFIELFNETFDRRLAVRGQARWMNHTLRAAVLLANHPYLDEDAQRTILENVRRNPPDWLRGRPVKITDVIGPRAWTHALENDGKPAAGSAGVSSEYERASGDFDLAVEV